MKLKLGFSTCPNDTFIFDALIHQKIDTEGLTFDVEISDLEKLNKKAFDKAIDITKISFHAYAKISSDYMLLNSGSALGRNNGPLLISKLKIKPFEINDLRIAIPGDNTTANLLFKIAFPDVHDKVEYLFSDIEDAVINEDVDAGLIIHENRFTYKSKGLRKVVDLGEHWEDNTGYPVPLGGIAIGRDIPQQVKQKVDRVLQRSIEYALRHPKEAMPFIKKHAQQTNEAIIEKHINLFVNEFTVQLGELGREAIVNLYEKAREQSLIPAIAKTIFVEKEF